MMASNGWPAKLVTPYSTASKAGQPSKSGAKGRRKVQRSVGRGSTISGSSMHIPYIADIHLGRTRHVWLGWSVALLPGFHRQHAGVGDEDAVSGQPVRRSLKHRHSLLDGVLLSARRRSKT